MKKQRSATNPAILPVEAQSTRDGRHTVMIMVNQLGAGGAEQQIATLVKGIDKQQFRVLVLTLYPRGATEAVVKQVPGVELICLNRKGKYDISPAFKVWRILRGQKVDIIQPFLSPATLFGLLPALLAGTPVRVVTERCGVRNNTHFGFRALQKIEDVFGHSAQVAVANSEAGRRFLIERGYVQVKTRVIYNGLNFARLRIDPIKAEGIRAETGIKPGDPVVGINAWLWVGKDPETFLRSAHLIHQKRPEVQFALLGDGPLRSHLEDLAKELDISKQVFFFGAQKEVGTYLSLFDILVSSSIDHEGCSNSILEAQALGKPVVATDIGGNRELVESGKNGFLITPRDPLAMAKAVFDLLENPDLAFRMGKNGQNMVLDRFQSERMVTDYQDLWGQLLEEQGRRAIARP